MAQIELSLGQILDLEAELNGYTNPQTNERLLEGFLKEKISLTVKYHLSKLSDELRKERETVEKLKNDLINELGTPREDGTISVDMFEDDDKTKLNPKFIEFQQKYVELINETRTIEYQPIPISVLENITSEYNYVILYKLIQE